MPTEEGKDLVTQALTLGGGGLALTALGAFVRGLFSGTGAQEKELRDGLAARVAALETKVEGLEKRLSTAERLKDAWRWAAMTARLEAEKLAARAGITLPDWEDPKEDG